jgi:hypothetical protein
MTTLSDLESLWAPPRVHDAGDLAAYLNLVDHRELLVSTEHIELP